jgi:hypothetical protein
MLAGRYDQSLSTVSASARDAYVEGCELALILYPGAVEGFDRALATDPTAIQTHTTPTGDPRWVLLPRRLAQG